MELLAADVAAARATARQARAQLGAARRRRERAAAMRRDDRARRARLRSQPVSAAAEEARVGAPAPGGPRR